MRTTWILICLLFCALSVNAQEPEPIDNNFLEDQLFITLSYDILLNKPKGIEQNGFSGGFSLGFIKDIPLNRSGKFAMAVGLGYSYDAYIQNLKITDGNGLTSFTKAENFNSNSLKVHSIDLPIELRWRSATPTRYKFWRTYAGFQFSYLYKVLSKYSDGDGTIVIKDFSEIENLQYGVYLAAGYSTWNIYVYVGLNELFNEASFESMPLQLKPFKIGLKFYIL